MTTLNEITMGPVHRTSAMPPVDVPITFEDDGTFKGDGAANFQAAGTSPQCSSQSSSSLMFHVSGQAVETSEEQSMHFQFESSSPTVTNASVECPVVGEVNTQNTTENKEVLPFDFKGQVGEAFDYHMPVTMPALTSTMHMEIVKTDEPAP